MRTQPLIAGGCLSSVWRAKLEVEAAIPVKQEKAAIDTTHWTEVETWLRTLGGSALLCFENAEDALRSGAAQVPTPSSAYGVHDMQKPQNAVVASACSQRGL